MVTNYQARAALIAAGKFDATDAAVRASGDTLTIQAWDYANNFYRDSAFITAMAGVLKMASADVDALFVAAGAVN